MAGENSTIARPYAEAVFRLAEGSGQLEQWSDMLALIDAIVADPQISSLVSNPKLSKFELSDLISSICGDKLSAQGAKLVALLAENERLTVMPEIMVLFEVLKNEKKGAIDVTVSSAFELADVQRTTLADALRSKLGREINIVSDVDPSLLGGVIIRAGDMVIDGSISGRLRKLANELGI